MLDDYAIKLNRHVDVNQVKTWLIYFVNGYKFDTQS